MKSWLANFWLDPHPRQEKIRQIWNLLLRRSATPLFSESSRALDYDGWLQSRAYLWPSANSYRDVVSRFGRLHSLYLRDKISHSAATEALQEEASAINFRDHWNSTMLFDMARASRQIGLFAGSSGLYETGQAAFERELLRSDNPRKAIGLTRLAIQRGDQAKAEHFAGVLRRTKVQIPVTRLLARYVGLWAGNHSPESLESLSESDSHYRDLVHGRKILIFGPGPTTAFEEIDFVDFTIARIIFYSDVGMSVNGTERGRTDLAYSNGINTRRLERLSSPLLLNFMSQFSAHTGRLGSTSGALEGAGKLTRLLPAEPILLTGGSNMAQTMLLDLLSFSPKEVFLKGITFYTGGQPYRKGHERQVYSSKDHEGPEAPTDEHYKLCSDIGGHSPQENRRLILNLWNAGRVDGDEYVRQGLSLTEDGYLAALDNQFGVGRL
tara:strand:+ start:13879 stop:15192 length:1314 start_codon:yes stop_codon:yes gene_type:complete